MTPLPPGTRIWLALGKTDMRRGMASLALQIQETVKLDPHSGHVFVFRGRRAQQATFRIQFAFRDDCVSVAPSAWAHGSSLAIPAWESSGVHLH